MNAPLTNLWSLMESDVRQIVECVDRLTRLTEKLVNDYCVARHLTSGLEHIPDEKRDSLLRLVATFADWSRAHGLNAALDRAARVEETIRNADNALGFSVEIMILKQTLEDELKRRVFLYLPDDESVSLYQNPAALFPLSLLKFPSSATDICEAARSFAVGRHTACVFHCMGILQAGLYVLAAELGVAFPFKIELADWENVIAGIESKIATIKALKKSDQKDADLKFYAGLAIQFRFFKDAWRNHVAHLREEYDRDQAHSILIHVRDFMEQAATRLQEMTVRP